jgi:hypothetical protein
VGSQQRSVGRHLNSDAQVARLRIGDSEMKIRRCFENHEKVITAAKQRSLPYNQRRRLLEDRYLRHGKQIER